MKVLPYPSQWLQKTGRNFQVSGVRVNIQRMENSNSETNSHTTSQHNTEVLPMARLELPRETAILPIRQISTGNKCNQGSPVLLGLLKQSLQWQNGWKQRLLNQVKSAILGNINPTHSGSYLEPRKGDFKEESSSSLEVRKHSSQTDGSTAQSAWVQRTGVWLFSSMSDG